MAQTQNIANFVQKKVDYYLDKWEIFTNSDEKVSWNWAAFLFSVYWMIYRKMYAPALVVYAASRVIRYVLIAMDMTVAGKAASGFLSITIALTIGMVGNYLYYRYATNKIQEVSARMQSSDPSVLAFTLERIGGTSLLWVFVLAIFGSAVDALLVLALQGKFSGDVDTLDADTIFDAL